MNSLSHCLHFHVSFSTAFAFALVSALSGCGGSTQGHGSSDSAQGDPAHAKTVRSAKPMTNIEATATRPSASLGTSPFHIVADIDYRLELQRLGKTGVLVASGQLLPIRDNTIAFDPKYALGQEIIGDGIRGAFQFLVGVFPDALFASVVRPAGRTGFTELYKWNGSKWVSDYNTDESAFVLDIQPWLSGTVLMVEVHHFSGEYRFTTWPKSTKVFVPEPRDRKWKSASSMCEMGFVPDALGTLPSGHVFVTGMTCSSGDLPERGQIGVKRWSPDDKAGTIDTLPDIGTKGFTLVNLALRNEKDAYVGGNTAPLRYGQHLKLAPYLAHFDGKSWTTDTLPFSDSIASLDVDANGKLWIVSSKGAVFSRPASGVWVEVSLPVGGEDRAPIAATTIWVRGPGDEWMIGSYKSRHVVLHSGPRAEMAQLPDLETMGDVSAELAMPTPLTWRCVTPFVLLYTLSKVAPADFDYPATREALKGHTEFDGARFIEFKRLDKRYMGAFVPEVEMGKMLVDLVKKKVPNSTPQLVCHAPKASRAIEINLSGAK